MRKHVFAFALALLLCVELAAPALAIYDMGKIGEFQTISSNGNSYMAIDDRGTLWSWTERSSPERKLDHVASVSCGKDFTMAIKTDGTLWSWGGNSDGQLGQGTSDFYYSEQDRLERATIPVKIMDNVSAVSAGESYAMAIQTDGTLWAWGTNKYGQLGNGSGSSEYAPVKVMDDVAAVSAGRSSTLAVKTDGTLWAWGSNGTSKNTGFLGFSGASEIRENIYCQMVPRQVYGIDHVVAISNGGSIFMALKDDGTLWSWGIDDGSGNAHCAVKLGYNETNKSFTLSTGRSGILLYEQTTPKQVTNHISAACFGSKNGQTNDFAMAIKTDGTLWAWGENGYIDGSKSILGFTGGDVVISVGPNTSPTARGMCWQSVPRKVEQISDVAEVSGTLVRKSDGTLWQLINGSFAPIELSDFIVSEEGRLEAYIGIDEDVIIPDKVTVVGSDTFSSNTALTGVTIPDSVTTIEANAFSGCTALTNVTISNRVTAIEENAFSGCTSLASIVIPNGVLRIGNGAFANCTNLASVVIPDGVTRIGSGAFSGCTGLTSIVIPDSVTEISPDAFADCVSLIDVTAPKKGSVTDGVFDQTPYQEKKDAQHAMMVTMLAGSAVAVVILVLLLAALKRKKDPEGYARKKQEQEERRKEREAKQAAAEEVRNAKRAAEEEAQKEKRAAEERARREQKAAAQAKRRIEAVLSGTITCSCGAVNPATAQFCSGCGKPVKVPGRCACGHQNDPEAKFCQGCGKPLGGGEDPHEA